MVTHIEHYELLSDIQHGFRQRRGCETQMALLIEIVAVWHQRQCTWMDSVLSN